MEQFSDKLIEITVGSVLGAFAFFHSRILNGYDKRIEQTERKQDEILKTLNKVDRDVVKIATKLEVLEK